MILECLRENSANMRIEQANLRDRITQALVRARTSLLCIRQLNIELQEMKLTVDNALANDFQDLADYDGPEIDEISENILEQPTIEVLDETAQESPNGASPDQLNENDTGIR